MDNIWLNVLGELVNVISGVILAGLSGLGAFYIARLVKNMKRKSFKEEIETYVRGVEQSPIYGILPGLEKYNLVKEFAKRKAVEYEIAIPEDELGLLIESKVQLMNSDIKAISNMLLKEVSGSPVIKILEEEPPVKTNDKKAVG